MKKITALIIAAAIILSNIGIVSYAEEKTGVTVRANELYQTQKPVDGWPRTCEAWIKVDKNAGTDRLGVIVGNYMPGTPSVNMEIRQNGQASFWWSNGSNNKTITFEKTDLRTGEWTFLAMTASEKEVCCYVNGELVQKKDADIYKQEDSLMNIICLAGDLRSGNAQSLKNTTLNSAAIYKSVRTEEQIKEDMKAYDPSDDSLLGLWNLSVSGADRLNDLSKNGKNLRFTDTKDPSRNEPQKAASEEPKEGLSFNKDTLYRSSAKAEALPLTYEATVWLSDSCNPSERAGVIIGNYGVGGDNFSFEVYSNGAPRLYITDASGKVSDVVFGTVNLYNGEKNHIAVTIDKTENKINCYVNGVLKEKKSFTCPEFEPRSKFCLGGDLRSGNERFFIGKIFDATIYSDTRTAEEVKNDFGNPCSDMDNMIFGCNLNEVFETQPKKITDLTGKKNMSPVQTYFDEREPLKDYAYSFAVIGDTQIMNRSHTEGFKAIYDWLLENASKKNIKYVFGMGDITDGNTDGEWQRAVQQFKRMDGVIPYSLVRGNHDSSDKFNKYVNFDSYVQTVEGNYEGKYENTWRIIEVGDNKYLIFTLDYGANDKVLSWASEIIEDHRDCNVIITTHAYLFRDGTTLDQNDVCPPATTGGSNNGDAIWKKFVSKHDNIVLVLCGHDPCSDIIMAQTKGEKGNMVTQLLVDPQGIDLQGEGSGAVCMLYFSEDGKNVQVEYYSTVQKKYISNDSQFEFEMNVIKSEQPEATPTPEATPEVTPTEAPEATPTPEATPEVTPTEAPEATPEVTPTEAPEATPEATPEVTPETTPEVTPTATPEVTPAATKEPINNKGCGGMICSGTVTVFAAVSVLFLKKKKRR